MIDSNVIFCSASELKYFGSQTCNAIRTVSISQEKCDNQNKEVTCMLLFAIKILISKVHCAQKNRSKEPKNLEYRRPVSHTSDTHAAPATTLSLLNSRLPR